jgi:hypothetical protein
MRRGAVAVERCRHDHGCGNPKGQGAATDDRGCGGGIAVPRYVAPADGQRQRQAAPASFDLGVVGQRLLDVLLPAEPVEVRTDLDDQMFAVLGYERLGPNAVGCGTNYVVHGCSLRREC